GGEAGEAKAFVYIAAEDLLTEAPMDPVAPDLDLVGLCPVRATDSRIDLVAVGQQQAQAWRIADRGADALAAEPIPDAPAAEECVARLRRRAAGLSFAIDAQPDEVSDAAAASLGGVGVEIAAVPDAGVLRVRVDGEGEAVEMTVDAAMNAAAATRPSRVAASGANFGGSYGGGVVLVTQGGVISVLALDDVVAEARRARRAERG
ncbi:MAG: hypothetical protein MI723_18080, partial [Caulobacterales bacterium]|nr:hypothetical protein [Caulobacterales bacterium]